MKISKTHHKTKKGVIKRNPRKKRPKFVIATVRVMAVDEEDDSQYEEAMEFEYASKDYETFDQALSKNPLVKDWELTGNAYSMKAPKPVVMAFRNIIQKKYPKRKIGIEWNYWVQ